MKKLTESVLMERDILIGALTVILRSLIMIFFSGRFLGIFSHYVVYKLRDLSLLEFKLAFNNY